MIRTTHGPGAPLNIAADILPVKLGTHPPRAEGALHLVAGKRGSGTSIAGLRQQGSLKALFPRRHADSLEMVLLNTAGGLTGGDRMTVKLEADVDAHLVVSTQAAERACRAMTDSQAKVDFALNVGPGARIDWLPQETILFEGAALNRRLRADLAMDARLFVVEPVILGRPAMGEVLHAAALWDRWEVRRGKALVFADALRLEGDITATMLRAATAGGAGAFASILCVAPDAERHLPPLRALLPPSAGASLIRDGVLFGRILATDGFELRRTLIPVIEYLTGASLPKVWRL